MPTLKRKSSYIRKPREWSIVRTRRVDGLLDASRLNLVRRQSTIEDYICSAPLGLSTPQAWSLLEVESCYNDTVRTTSGWHWLVHQGISEINVRDDLSIGKKTPWPTRGELFDIYPTQMGNPVHVQDDVLT